MGRVAFDEDLKGFRLAYMKDGAADDIGPCGFFWLGGYKSEMTGTKAENLADLARATRRNFLRFDYSGHGQSDGLFIDGTISHWLEQATHMFLRHTQNPRIIVGLEHGRLAGPAAGQALAERRPAGRPPHRRAWC